MTAVHDLVEALNAQAREKSWPARCDATLAFEEPQLAFFVQTWQSQLRGRVMPARSDVTVRVLKQHLHRIILLERVEDEQKGRRYRVRLMASGLAHIWGDMTGKYLDEVIPPHLLPRWHGFSDLVLHVRQPLRFTAKVEFQGKDFLVAELAIVPLSDDAGRPTMVMAAVHTSGDRSWEAAMARFDGIHPKRQRRLEAVRAATSS
jgi:hypothetical protein